MDLAVLHIVASRASVHLEHSTGPPQNLKSVQEELRAAASKAEAAVAEEALSLRAVRRLGTFVLQVASSVSFNCMSA